MSTLGRNLSLGTACATGLVFVLIGHVLVGVLAAILTSASYWDGLRAYPGLAMSLHSIVIGSLPLMVFFAALSAALVRLVPGVTPLHVMVCALTVLAWGLFDLTAVLHFLLPANQAPNVFHALSALVSVAAMPFAIWLGGRLARSPA